MQSALEVGKFLFAHGQELVSGAAAVCAGLVAIFLLIPGEQPEKAIKAVGEFLAKFSRKPKAE